MLDWLLVPTGLTAHGFCLSWAPGLVALHVVSDALVGLAYFSIPAALAMFVRRRPDIKYGWVAWLFVAFILACGATHVFAILTLWVPVYWMEGLVKLVTAGLSVATAVILWRLIPILVGLPSAAQLETLNAQLRTHEAEMLAANAALEERVIERTAELSAANAELAGMVEERTAALAQRDLLLREVYHRVKNNLQIVDSLLVMQARQVADPDAKSALLGLRSRIYALGLVHQQLMGSADLQTFDFAPFLRELSANIVEGGADAEISLTVDAQPLVVGLDFAIPLGLLVTELVTNSLKHAFAAGKGEIAVTMTVGDDGAVSLVVADNGRGYDTAQAAAAGPKGLGANIIKGLLAQLRGTMSVHNEGGARSEIRVAGPPVAPVTA